MSAADARSRPGTFAAVHGIRIDGDRWTGGADPGRDGMALAV